VVKSFTVRSASDVLDESIAGILARDPGRPGSPGDQAALEKLPSAMEISSTVQLPSRSRFTNR